MHYSLYFRWLHFWSIFHLIKYDSFRFVIMELISFVLVSQTHSHFLPLSMQLTTIVFKYCFISFFFLIISFLSTFPSKRGLKPVYQSSFDNFDGADINLVFSTHECSGDSPRWLQTHFSSTKAKWKNDLSWKYIIFALSWLDLQSNPSVLSWRFFLFMFYVVFFAQDGVLVDRMHYACD